MRLPAAIDFSEEKPQYTTYEAALFWQLKEQRTLWSQ
jgi:hypothetical protein